MSRGNSVPLGGPPPPGAYVCLWEPGKALPVYVLVSTTFLLIDLRGLASKVILFFLSIFFRMQNTIPIIATTLSDEAH